MMQFAILGRGGQGAQLAGQMLAAAYFREGKYIQSFASYGGARRGTPVNAYLRVDERPIVLRCDIENPDAILCFDASLLNEGLVGAAAPDTLIMVNTMKSRAQLKWAREKGVITFDAATIARRHGLGRILNSTLVGAFAALVGSPRVESLLDAVREISPVRAEENMASCLEGYRLL